MTYSDEEARATWSPECFLVDLNAVRDDNLVVTLVGFLSPQRVPNPGEDAVAIDEDRYAYAAIVEAVLPDNRVYLRVDWSSRRSAFPTEVENFCDEDAQDWGVDGPVSAGPQFAATSS